MTNTSTFSVQEHVRIIYVLFLAATGASFAYCLMLGQFNGDFFPQPVFLSTGMLIAVLIACLAPYVITWRLVGALDRLPPRRVFQASPAALLVFLLVGEFAQMAVTILYGVGLMNREVYTAPATVMPLIQVLNRLDPFYLGVFFILSTPKRPPTDLLAIVLMVAVGILRAGLGAFAYVAIALCIKYRSELALLFRRVPWLVIGVGSILPTMISMLYDIRSHLRGEMQFDFSMSEILFGRFVGRLSAFSNVAFIEQNSQSFQWASKMLEPLFYAKQALVSLLGSSVAPTITPERLLIAGTQSYEGYSTFMAGIPGNLIMAWNVSPWVAAFNVVLIAGSIAAILWLSRYLGNEIARAFGLAMLFYPLTSGVANEFASLLLNTIFFLAFTMIFTRRSTVERPAYGA